MAALQLELGTTEKGHLFRLPATEAETQTIVVYGGRGMGKTNLGAVLCEELAAAGKRFCFLDPMGVAWGLRHSADGSGEGIKIIILGGRHGDLPIEPTGGAVVAEFVATTAENILIDVSSAADGTRWSQGQKIRFVADYTERLLEIQGEHRRPLMQIYDEAARFAPQVIEMKRDADDPAVRCKVALEQLLEEGRNAAIGVMLLTQRSARMAKSVSELAELMVAFRIVGPNSTNAVLEWFGAHVDKARHNVLLEQLRKLPRGEALAVSPGWLDLEGVVRVRLRHTFDSSKTPTGTEKKLAQRIRPANLEKLREQIAATVEKAEAADPKKIRESFRTKLQAAETAARESNARVGVLEAKLAKLQEKPAPAAAAVKEARLRASDRAQLEAIAKRIEAATGALQKAAPAVLAKISTVFEKASKEIGEALTQPDFAALMRAIAPTSPAPIVRMTTSPAPAALKPATREALERTARTVAADTLAPPRRPPPPIGALKEERRLYTDKGVLNKPARAFLTALAQYNRPLSRAVLHSASGYKPSGDTQKAIAALRDHGLTTESADGFTITEAGRAALGDYDPLPTGAELLAHLVDSSTSSLSAAERKLMRALYDAKQHPLTREAWLERAGLRPSGDTQKAMAKFLRIEWAKQLEGGGIVAADTFYE